MIQSIQQASASQSIQKERLHSAAQKFEAMMLNELLKPLQKAFSGDDTEEGGSVLASYGTEALAEGLVRSGGIGIAKRIEDHLANNTPK